MTLPITTRIDTRKNKSLPERIDYAFVVCYNDKPSYTFTSLKKAIAEIKTFEDIVPETLDVKQIKADLKAVACTTIPLGAGAELTLTKVELY